MDPLLHHLPPYRPPPETPKEPMEFLSRSWSLSSAKTLSSPINTQLINNSTKNQLLMSFSVAAGDDVILECPAAEDAAAVSGNASFSFASYETSQLVMERIMSHSQEVSPRTSGRLSHSSGPLNGSLTDSPPDSPSDDKEDGK